MKLLQLREPLILADSRIIVTTTIIRVVILILTTQEGWGLLKREKQ